MRTFAPIVALLAATACSPKAPNIAIADPVVVATPMGGAAYMTIRNRGGSDRLLAVKAPTIADLSIHETVRDGSIMRMRPVGTVEIPANGEVNFKRGGLHIMLMGSSEAIQPGKSFPLTLSFEKAGEIRVTAPVKTPDASMEAM